MFNVELDSQGNGKQWLPMLNSHLDSLLKHENIRLGSSSRGSMTGSDSRGTANESTIIASVWLLFCLTASDFDKNRIVTNKQF